MNKKISDNGITVCDSIVMSVRRKRINIRRIEAVAIAVIGYVSVIMAFVNMFDFKFNHRTLVFSALLFSVVYITLSLAGKKAMWVVFATIIAGAGTAYKTFDMLVMGYKYAYNIIYRTAMYKDIDYYKFLRPELEESAVTALFVFGAWVLAVVIYVFTIHHPNSLPPLLVTFPLIETGLYNGIEISVFWGMLLVAYWLAIFAMTSIDMGEYSGGNGGFVRKENLFFPKRQMKLKVTEKCGVYIIIAVIAITGITAFVLDMIAYERSEEINKKRIEIRDAVSSFSMDDLAGSLSELTSAFGFTFKVQSHKLGNVDKLKYKETTDMIVTLDNMYGGAIYLKEYTGSVYSNNEWNILPDSAYNDSIFDDFEKYNTYPQNFPYKFKNFVNLYDSNLNEYTIWINSKLRKNRSFAPYGTDSIGILEYDFDNNVTSKSGNDYSYKFTKVEAEDIVKKLNVLKSDAETYHNILNYNDDIWKNQLADYIAEKNLTLDNGNFQIEDELFYAYNDAEVNLAELVENDYRDFVYANYLQLPDNDDMDEIRTEFDYILNNPNMSQIEVLTELRNKVSSMAEYSLNPGRTPATRDFVNYFLLENHKGYCTHYATAGVILARMAGIPARYATGYVIVGDDFNDSTLNNDGTYTITLKDNRSHAWVEVYIDGYGWTPFEFTAGYSSQTIDTTPTTSTTTKGSTETTTTVTADSNQTTTRPNRQTTTDVDGTETPETFITEVTVTTTVETVETVSKEMPKSVKYIINTVLAVALLAVLILARRVLILMLRDKRFNDGTRRSRMAYMYAYSEKLLKYLKIKRDDMQYIAFAEHVEDLLDGKYFSSGEFSEFMNTALKSAFSEYPPENDELKKSAEFVNSFAKKIYESANSVEKIHLRFILVIL